MSVENGRGMIRGTCGELAELPLARILHEILNFGKSAPKKARRGDFQAKLRSIAPSMTFGSDTTPFPPSLVCRRIALSAPATGVSPLCLAMGAPTVPSPP